MNIENLLKEIEIEGEEELNRLKEEFEKELNKIKKDYDERVSNLKKEWSEKIQKETSLYIEKKELDLKTKIDLLYLDWKNKVLDSFKKYYLEKLKKLESNEKKNFLKKEILKNLESPDLEIHFDKKEKEIFDENFKREIEDYTKEKFKKSNLKFVEDEEIFIKGKGFITKISIYDIFDEIMNKYLLDISKLIFEEDETKK
jgi:vacuolar-type H+-ATPase subunit E/Vma4